MGRSPAPDRRVIFTAAPLAGAMIVDIEARSDERGFFARAWCREELVAAGLDPRLEQANISFSDHRGTLRGLHYQRAPHAEVKLIRCTRGAIYDVIVDLRPDSTTYLGSFGIELTDENRRMLYVPEGFAHGYQTLTDGAEAFYWVSAAYAPEAEGGMRWDDPLCKISWPIIEEARLSEKDLGWPDYEPEAA